MLTLYVWGPGWDLPSIDPGCLTVIVYFQLLVSEEWGIIECNNPNISPTGTEPFQYFFTATGAIKILSQLNNDNLFSQGELPVLKDGVEWVAGVSNIIKHVKRKGFDADEDLTAEQNADCMAQVSNIYIYSSSLIN